MTYVEMLVDSVRMDIDDTSRMIRPNGVDGYCIDIDDTHVRSWVVVLKDPDSDRTLLITIGPAEAEAIAFKLQESAISRPMSHDLMLNLTTAFGASIQEVRITGWEYETFFAAVVIARDGRAKEIDARPSDAIALALRAQAPIYVHTAVREQAEAHVKPTGTPPSATKQVLVKRQQPGKMDAA